MYSNQLLWRIMYWQEVHLGWFGIVNHRHLDVLHGFCKWPIISITEVVTSTKCISASTHTKTRLSEWSQHLTHWGRDKWPPFFRRHFQMDFLEWKCVDFDYDFTEVCSNGTNLQYTSIGLDNGLAPARRQAIIWTNGGKFSDAYMRHPASMS